MANKNLNKKYKDRACAKINLSLDVLKKRKDGYHEVDHIMYTLKNLYDEITIIAKKKEGNAPKIYIKTNKKIPGAKSKNLAYKACDLFIKKFYIDDDIYVYIKKNIPIASGMGGGSSDAASCIKLLNKIYNLKLSDKTLCKISSPLGADVPHFILGGTNRASGIGQNLKRINHFKVPTILLAKANIKKKTSDIYTKIDKHASCFGRVKISKIVTLLNNNNFYSAVPLFQNILEMAYDNKKIIRIKNKMIERGALCSIMSGAGPTVFGIFKNKKDAFCCAKILKKGDRNLWVSIV